ncbi:MAG: hypothetical protein J7454_15280, partial [Roseiflexus sp.]|nr:hypothetical protein [Roseiflexus sp.]
VFETPASFAIWLIVTLRGTVRFVDIIFPVERRLVRSLRSNAFLTFSAPLVYHSKLRGAM